MTAWYVGTGSSLAPQKLSHPQLKIVVACAWATWYPKLKDAKQQNTFPLQASIGGTVRPTQA